MDATKNKDDGFDSIHPNEERRRVTGAVRRCFAVVAWSPCGSCGVDPRGRPIVAVAAAQGCTAALSGRPPTIWTITNRTHRNRTHRNRTHRNRAYRNRAHRSRIHRSRIHRSRIHRNRDQTKIQKTDPPWKASWTDVPPSKKLILDVF
jgi:hypothetical protein